jgi:dipeptidyl aminopeptidase/acylaminoacyl peptidase
MKRLVVRSSIPQAEPAAISATSVHRTHEPARWPLSSLVVALILVSAAGSAFVYALISIIAADALSYAAPSRVGSSPASIGLDYQPVTFHSRTDHVQLRGWLIPAQTAGWRSLQDVVVVVHGTRANRADPSIGVLDWSGELARHGFGVLAFDMRGMGESAPAPISFGQFEMRDVLGAVDLLRNGPLPNPELGRPRFIGAWGVSMGAATVLLAAAHDAHIQAVVSDSAYADILPLLEREVPAQGGLPAAFTPGTLRAARVLYGIDIYSVRPADAIAAIAPRPVFLIHGDSDTYVPTSNLQLLQRAAMTGRGARVTTWLVPGANHGQAFHVAGVEYVQRVTAFFSSAAQGRGT